MLIDSADLSLKLILKNIITMNTDKSEIRIKTG